jgi:hypothetical protein
MSVGYRDDPLPKPMPWRCDTCKHWEHDPDHWPEDETTLGWCTRITTERGVAAWMSGPSLFATRQDFFCALYEPR